MNHRAAPDTLIIDNIECSRGKDVHSIRTSYEEYFTKYIRDQRAKDPSFPYRKVYIGEGYSGVGLSDLKSVERIQPPSSIYSDAERQRLLLEMPEKDFKQLNEYDCSFCTCNNQTWLEMKDDIAALEQSAFDGKGTSVEELEEMFKNKDNILITLRKKGKVIGYSIGEPRENATLYISSTCITKEEQGKGLVKYLNASMDRYARSRGFKMYTRDARTEHDYAKKLKQHYRVIKQEQPVDSPYGPQQHLTLAIPGVRISRSTVNVVRKQNPQRLDITWGRSSQQA